MEVVHTSLVQAAGGSVVNLPTFASAVFRLTPLDVPELKTKCDCCNADTASPWPDQSLKVLESCRREQGALVPACPYFYFACVAGKAGRIL